MVEQLVEQIEARFGDVQAQMSDPEVIGDRQRYAEVGRGYRALEPAHRDVVEREDPERFLSHFSSRRCA